MPSAKCYPLLSSPTVQNDEHDREDNHQQYGCCVMLNSLYMFIQGLIGTDLVFERLVICTSPSTLPLKPCSSTKQPKSMMPLTLPWCTPPFSGLSSKGAGGGLLPAGPSLCLALLGSGLWLRRLLERPSLSLLVLRCCRFLSLSQCLSLSGLSV